MQEDAGGNGHVEGFDAASHRDPDPPGGGCFETGTHAGAFVPDHQEDRGPLGRAARHAVQAFPADGRHPDLGPLQVAPGHHFLGGGGNRRQTKGGAHTGADDLGVGQIGRASESDDAGGAQPQRGPEHGAHVARILHRVEHQRGHAGHQPDVGQAPALRLYHRGYALRMLGVGETFELRVTHLLQPDSALEQSSFQRLPAGGSFQRWRHGGASDVDAGGERLFDQTNSFGQRQAAPLPAAASVKVPDQRLEGAAHAETHPMKIALTIAGSDSGGGAGIQADLKTFQQFGVFGTSVIVALTAQNTVGVRAVETVPESMIGAQLTALAEDLPPAALKTGMLAEAGVVRQVARAIRENGWSPLVVDPVMVSTSGARLLTDEAEDVIREDLLPLASLVTPNIDEAAILTGRVVHDLASMERAAAAMLRFGPGAVLVKGGHLTGDITDILATPGGMRRFTHPRIETTSTHGTGCTLSAAITAGLALGWPLEAAVVTALEFVHRAIASAPNLGAGHGPLNHMVPATTSAR